MTNEHRSGRARLVPSTGAPRSTGIPAQRKELQSSYIPNFSGNNNNNNSNSNSNSNSNNFPDYSTPSTFQVTTTQVQQSTRNSGTEDVDYPAKRRKSFTSVQPYPGLSSSRLDKHSERVEIRVENRHRQDNRHSRRHHGSDQGTFELCRDQTERKSTLNGPIAAAEFEKLRQEVETLKEALHESKKVSKRHAKKLEECKVELNAAIQALKERELDLSTSKAKTRASDELLSTIESCVQCQICMDLPDNPFSLSPCGHILCLTCLQEWFRKAPPSLDDMDIDPEELTDPTFVLMRKKTCPSCRATVKHRPAPVFMVKAIVTALNKGKPIRLGASPSQAGTHTFSNDDNPWSGIFASSDEEDDNESAFNSVDSDSTEDMHIGLRFIDMNRGQIVRRFTNFPRADISDSDFDDEDSEENSEEDEVRYVMPRWQPPQTFVNLNDYAMPDGFTDEDNVESIRLLQRGCSWEMLVRFHISYYHDRGIVVQLPSLDALEDIEDTEDQSGGVLALNRLHLGWNISLDRGDIDGSIYLARALHGIKDHPTEWRVRPRPGYLSASDAWRLVRESDVEEYDTSDTEIWADAEDF